MDIQYITTLNLHFRQQRILVSPTLISFGEFARPNFTFFSIMEHPQGQRVNEKIVLIKAIFVSLVTAHVICVLRTAQMGLELHILCRTAR